MADSLCLGSTMTRPIDFDASVDGGGDDNGGGNNHDDDKDLVWVSLEIWQSQNPEVFCSFPCTVVLLPYTSFTTSHNYPVVTISEDD